MPPEEIVSRLAVLRKKAGLSQLDLARLLDVTPNTIANWEHKRVSLLPFAHIAKMCVIFDCSPEDLIRYVPCTQLDKPRQKKKAKRDGIQADLDEMQKNLGTNESKAVNIDVPVVSE